MLIALLLSSIAAGIIATFAMSVVLYLPRLWEGGVYDAFRALGSALVREDDERAFFVGALAYFGGGLVFALLYGWAALALLGLPAGGTPLLPAWTAIPGLPVSVNPAYPLLGVVLGLGHGVVVALLLTIVVVEHHPVARYRDRPTFALSQLIAHATYGAVVMFFHSQFLQLLLPGLWARAAG